MVATTHRRFGKVADGTSTRVMTYMINRWRVKIDWKGIYNVRNPLGKRDPSEESGGEDKSNLHDLRSLWNLALKKEEEH